MSKRVFMILVGLALVAVHLVWRLAKQGEPLRGVLAQSDVLNWGLFALAWLCLLGAVPLLASALVRRDRRSDAV